MHLSSLPTKHSVSIVIKIGMAEEEIQGGVIMSKNKRQRLHKIHVKPSSYQPSKAELEEEIQLPVTPDQLAECLRGEIVIDPKASP